MPNHRLLAFCLATLVTSACTKPSPPPARASGASGPAPVVDETPGPDTLVIAAQADAESFVSVVSQAANDSRVMDNMFLGLTASEFDCRIVFTPEIAESWDVADDGLSVTYHLRKDLKWSDGVALTARDVAYTYDLVGDPKVASPRFAYIERMKPDGRPRVLDDFTVRFEFTKAYDRWSQMAHCGLDVLPEHVLTKYDRASLRGTDFDKSPVVSGRWRIEKWDKNSALVLVPNEHFTGPHPAKLGRVILKVIPEYATRLIELENGSVDMIEAIQNTEDMVRLKREHPEIKQYRRGSRFMDYVAWNLKNPLFADKEVRQALTMAIDVQKLIKDLLTTSDGDVLGKPSVSWITPALCDYQSEALKPFPFDPEKARQVLAAHGWKDSNGDGILDKGGRPFRFTLLTNSGNPRRAKASVIIQANLKDVGVDAQLASVESNTFFERLRKKDFESALSGWSAGLFVDPTDLWHSDSKDKKYEFNFCSYSNPAADALIDQGMAIADPAQAAPVWQQLQSMIYEDQPYTFLYWRDEVVGLHRRFRGAKPDILSELHDLHEWWVPAGEMKYKR